MGLMDILGEKDFVDWIFLNLVLEGFSIGGGFFLICLHLLHGFGYQLYV